MAKTDILAYLSNSANQTFYAMQSALINLMEQNEVGCISFINADVDAVYTAIDEHKVIRVGAIIIPEYDYDKRYMMIIPWDDIMNTPKLDLFVNNDWLSPETIDAIIEDSIIWDYAYDITETCLFPIDTIISLSDAIHDFVNKHLVESGGGYNPSNHDKC